MSDTQTKETPAKKTSIAQFANEVRAEARKVTWATQGETITSSIMVFIMVIIAAAFFYLADVFLKSGVGALLSFAASLGK